MTQLATSPTRHDFPGLDLIMGMFSALKMAPVSYGNLHRRSRASSLMLVMAGVGGVLGLCSCPRADQSLPLEVHWPLARSGKEFVTLHIGAGYAGSERVAEAMNSAVYGSETDDTTDIAARTLLIPALWPGLEPHLPSNDSEFQVPGGGRVMITLVQAAAIDEFGGKHFDRLEDQFAQRVDQSTNHLCVTRMELPPGTKAGFCYQRNAPDVKPSRFGLPRLGVDFSKYPDMPEQSRTRLAANDLYFLRDRGGHVQTVIFCTADEVNAVDEGPQPYLSPQCSQKFVAHRLNALVTIGYRRVYLPQWQAIQSEWEKRLDSFVR